MEGAPTRGTAADAGAAEDRRSEIARLNSVAPIMLQWYGTYVAMALNVDPEISSLT
jgi:hypothetical protein